MTSFSKLAINIFPPKMVCIFCDFVVPGSWQLSPEWSSVKVLGVMTRIIARASNRIFVGPILCTIYPSVVIGRLIPSVIRQKSCLDRTCHWAYCCCCRNFLLSEACPFIFASVSLHTLSPSVILNMTFYRSLVNYFASKTLKRNHEGTKLLEPIIAARRDEEMKGGTEKPVRPCIYSSWNLILLFLTGRFPDMAHRWGRRGGQRGPRRCWTNVWSKFHRYLYIFYGGFSKSSHKIWTQLYCR